jgi:hypothetical protein
MKLQKDILLYRMVHIDNVPHILQNGLTQANSVHRNPNYVPIGDQTLIATRKEIMLLGKKTALGDYLPFYFGTRTPMLYTIQKGFNEVRVLSAEEIVYCVTSVQAIIDLKLDFIFTDGHAAAGLTRFYTVNDIQNIEQFVSFEAVNAQYWKEIPDMKRQKSSEFLVKGDVPMDKIMGFAVYNEPAKEVLIKAGVGNNQIGVRPNFYY